MQFTLSSSQPSYSSPPSRNPPPHLQPTLSIARRSHNLTTLSATTKSASVFQRISSFSSGSQHRAPSAASTIFKVWFFLIATYSQTHFYFQMRMDSHSHERLKSFGAQPCPIDPNLVFSDSSSPKLCFHCQKPANLACAACKNTPHHNGTL